MPKILRLESAPISLSCRVVTKAHTYLNKPAAEICRFAEVCVCDVLEPSGIKMVVKGAKICIKLRSFRT